MNKVLLIGNVGKEPEVKYYDADQAVAQFSLATTERGYVLPNGTRVPDRTDWHNIVVWRELAKIRRNMCIKATKSVSRVASVIVFMTIRRASDTTLLRFMPRIWSFLLLVTLLLPNHRL